MAPLASVGLLSIGEMGLGVANLLRAHNFRVITNLTGRSEQTRQRALSAGVELVPDDLQLIRNIDYFLSIVPPRDALPTAHRVATAVQLPGVLTERRLVYLDLNAVSPQSAEKLSEVLSSSKRITFIDGAILGGPPRPKQDSGFTEWYKPSIVTSGPVNVADCDKAGMQLHEALGLKHIGAEIGAASGLKMCFASTTKGFAALATLSFTTAHRLGVLDELLVQLQTVTPDTLRRAEAGLTSMSPKAYRWIKEMEEIASTFEEEGGFTNSVFDGIADVFRLIAEANDQRTKDEETVKEVVERVSRTIEAQIDAIKED